ncbi:F390 synthetase-related protein [Dongia sp. agr-C8]
MSPAVLHAAIAFWRTKRLMHRLRTRADVIAWRDRQLDRFLNRAVGRVPFYAGLDASRLDQLPIIDKATLLANFDRLNTKGVTGQQVRAALDRNESHAGGLMIGQSTGTSGNRGLFVISEAERFTWLGVMLAKTLPDFPFVRHRVAMILPGTSQLYAAATAIGRLTIRFFDLGQGVDRWRADLCAYAPDTLIAPPKVLRALAEAGGLHPKRVFSGAEMLDPLDRAVIESAFEARVREIYMATEGLFGVGCAEGVLHLAEDVVAFEWAPVDGAPGLATPIVTDFTRRTQIMARYRMNDLLRLSEAACRCGSPLQAVAAVEGRQDDVFHLSARGGADLVLVTPDVIRNAVVDADRRIQDFRVIQTGARAVDLVLDRGLAPDAAAAAAASLRTALERAGAAEVDITLKRGWESPMERKLRRVRRAWN